jgi:DegV family protein with EDD domain
MTRIAIVTDSTACIPESLLEELDIHWVPYYIYQGGETFRDQVTLTSREFYEWLPTVSDLPKTACPGPGDYLQEYKKLADEGDFEEIVSIHMTSKGSGAYLSACTAVEMVQEVMPDLVVKVIDTLNVSMSQGWMVIEAARAAQEGGSLAEVISRVKELIPVTRMIQTADTLKYLYLGGRIGKAKHLMGSLLNIKPLISMEDGIIIPLGTARSRNRAYKMMVEKVEAAVGYMGEIKIAYVHAAAMDEVEKIKGLIERRFTVVESMITELSPALGVHTGPGTAGLCYYPVGNISQSRS